MIIETFTCIEVENVPNVWAVDLFECEQHMKPVVPIFISVCNSYVEDKINYVDHVLCDMEPTKIIPSVTGEIADSYKEVGFWRIKYKN